MSLNARFKEIAGDINAKYQTLQILQFNRIQTNKKLEATQKEYEDNFQKVELKRKTLETFKSVILALSEEHINSLKAILNQAMSTIFTDRNYRMDIIIDDKRDNKSAEFSLVEIMDNGQEIKSDIDSIGGGVLTVIGLVLRVFYISHYGLRKVLFLDESLTQISSQYIDKTFQFMKYLSEHSGFYFILVNHDPRVLEYADTMHRVVMGQVSKEEVIF